MALFICESLQLQGKKSPKPKKNKQKNKRAGIYCPIYKESGRKIFTDYIREAPSLHKFDSVLWWRFLTAQPLTDCDSNLLVCCFSFGMGTLIMQTITAI